MGRKGETPLERPITLVKQIDSELITYWIAGEIDRTQNLNGLSLLSENVRRVLSENVRSMCVGRAPLTPRL